SKIVSANSPDDDDVKAGTVGRRSNKTETTTSLDESHHRPLTSTESDNRGRARDGNGRRTALLHNQIGDAESDIVATQEALDRNRLKSNLTQHRHTGLHWAELSQNNRTSIM